MKIKGRRQSENVVDIREPLAKAQRDIRIQNDPEQVAKRIDEEIVNRQEAADVQARIHDPVKQHFKDRKAKNIWLETDELWNRTQARSVQDAFGRTDAIGMEMLMGPRWKD